MQLDKHYQFIEAIKAMPPVKAVYLFGSRARDNASVRADIDIAVQCAPTTTAQQWQQVLDAVEDADTLLEIDCVRLDKQPKDGALYQHIMRDKIAL